MANGNGGGSDQDVARLYRDAFNAQMGERVTNLGRRVSDIENEMRSGFRQLETSISALASTMAERNKPQWQAIGVALTFAVIIGGMAYWPIRESTSDLRASVSAISSAMVTQRELEWRTARSMEDRARTDAAINGLREGLVSREEHQRIWDAENQTNQLLQRQIDDIRSRQMDRLERATISALP